METNSSTHLGVKERCACLSDAFPFRPLISSTVEPQSIAGFRSRRSSSTLREASSPNASTSSLLVLRPTSSRLFFTPTHEAVPGTHQTYLICRKSNVFNYAVSVPYRKVRANEEVLLAWEMNGEPLPKIHGFPLRVVVTGYIGARSCKWLYKINCLAEPSMGPVQRQEYLYYTAQVRPG